MHECGARGLGGCEGAFVAAFVAVEVETRGGGEGDVGGLWEAGENAVGEEEHGKERGRWHFFFLEQRDVDDDVS